MRLAPVEPDLGPWRVEPITRVLELLLPDRNSLRPRVIAVDGRSGSGKSTVAQRLIDAVMGSSNAAIVHTDDIAWHHSFFDWSELMREGVLLPARSGALPISFRPPAWDERERPGAVEIPARTALVVMEGVGAGRRDLADLVDATVWVQADADTIRRRAIEREGGDAAAEAFWAEWDAQEAPFLLRERPWARADLVINGTPDLPHDPRTQLVVGSRSGRSRPSPSK